MRGKSAHRNALANAMRTGTAPRSTPEAMEPPNSSVSPSESPPIRNDERYTHSIALPYARQSLFNGSAITQPRSSFGSQRSSTGNTAAAASAYPAPNSDASTIYRLFARVPSIVCARSITR